MSETTRAEYVRDAILAELAAEKYNDINYLYQAINLWRKAGDEEEARRCEELYNDKQNQAV